ncbi:hypothetical protein IW967_05170 [Alicyclobacillus mali]|uniref:Uncharacterized protein n=1 Tax=Alicyclobacillus mali (ex Roth et al. 2021) TaxID=1123961 RepID=A0ABS0F1U2_9BACL|nr:hypothetical protein [Alicyclobacillus mali (ex Roth et al. 2021)]MBF8377260.1 hypothetical protein [Alicyclobacillus mali (ex Roth et al. 2021)]MCL6488090.1 hypothetical protein [Alicyclobacillus mali (ex Roth et al. 2021)]
MENPRKRMARGDAEGRRGQVIDFRAYQKRRHRRHRGIRPVGEDYLILRGSAIVLAAASVVLAIFGLTPVPWKDNALVASLFADTLALAIGVILHVVRDRAAMRLLGALVGVFAFSYLCSLLHSAL